MYVSGQPGCTAIEHSEREVTSKIKSTINKYSGEEPAIVDYEGCTCRELSRSSTCIINFNITAAAQQPRRQERRYEQLQEGVGLAIWPYNIK